ncbi:MAG: 2-hydroxy-3-oxopropionate reductase [Chloroflexota bacterium]|jgi:2-hydroxy-3-oxopropionate reductase|nr:2-hydroxy-3-oxopropionate reductase [Chloroflexota bacterium]
MRDQEPRDEVVGFIGLGIMGRPMATNLLRAGRRVVVHSRSRPPVDELVAAGAEPGASVAGVAAAADVIITMLPDTPDLRAVVDGPEGLLEHARPGSLVIDMSTVDPLETRAIGAEFVRRGVGYVDAPVSGGERGAIDGALSIMAGGAEQDVARAMALFEILGKTIVHVGDVGAGQVTKAANQLVVGVTIQAVAEALALAEAAGIDAAKVRQALLGGFAASRVLEVHGQRMLDRQFQPGFRSRLHLKDARIIRNTASQLGVPTPALEVALDGFRRLAESDRGELDHSALFLLEERTEPPVG